VGVYVGVCGYGAHIDKTPEVGGRK
jgi:hypothetical protein